VKRAPVLTLFFLWRLHGQPKHAYLLLEDVRSVGFLSCKPSTIYALLSSMEKAGLVKSRLDTRARRARRLYSTTEKGWRVLASAKASHIKGLWRKFVGFLLR
jgi:DNA-binding PadR family transcriptional regulator